MIRMAKLALRQAAKRKGSLIFLAAMAAIGLAVVYVLRFSPVNTAVLAGGFALLALIPRRERRHGGLDDYGQPSHLGIGGGSF